MSPVRLNGSTSGYTELSAPAVAGNNSIALPTGNGTSGQFLQTNGSGALTFASAVINGSSSAIVSGTAVASTSRTSIDFTGIPSWVKRVTVMFNGVSTNGSAALLIQLGAGSVTTSGYLGTGYNLGSTAVNYTTGLGDGLTSAACLRQGSFVISSFGSNTWVCGANIGTSDAARIAAISGSVTLSGALDRVRITTTNGTDAFDSGSINILYE
mgnify:CR=1 FL=1